MSEEKTKEMEFEIGELKKEVSEMKGMLSELLFYVKSDPSTGHIGAFEQGQISAKDIEKLKIDKKILIGAGAIVMSIISGGAWLLTKLKSFA